MGCYMAAMEELKTDELKAEIEDRLKELNKRLGRNKMKGYTVYIWSKYGQDEEEENENENKQDEKEEEKESQISTLVDFKHNESGMCDKGHDMLVSWPRGDVCNVCGKNDGNVRGCLACCSVDVYKAGGGKQYLLCDVCLVNNVNKVKIKWQSDESTRTLIRSVLKGNPCLELDILCGLPKAAALNQTLKEIVKLHAYQRMDYSLYLIDLDNFKALNSAIGHSGADKVIIDIANVLKKYKKEVDDGKWNNEENGAAENGRITQMFAFRQGGDEFGVIVKGTGLRHSRERLFYESWKKEINALGAKHLANIASENEEKGQDTMRERERKKIFNALEGLKISKNTEKEINDAINKKEFGLALNKIGISVGMYFIIANNLNQTVDDWIKGAERAQDEVKKLVGKNDIRICKGMKWTSDPYEETIFDGESWDKIDEF